MPRVPVYSSPQVQQQPLPNVATRVNFPTVQAPDLGAPARAITQGGEQLTAMSDRWQQAALHVQAREDAVARVQDYSQYEEQVLQAYTDAQASGALETKDGPAQLRGQMFDLQRQIIESHQGSADSRAMLIQRLEGRRADWDSKITLTSLAMRGQKVEKFVFTNPQTGRPTLFNPSGLDLGDVAGVAREGVQMVGSGLGATAGALFGATLGAPTGPGALLTGTKGAVMSAGVGNALAGALFDTVLTLGTDRQDTRTGAEHVLDATIDFAFGAVGQMGGIVAGQAIKRAAGGGKAIARDLVEQFQRLGVTPTAGAVSGGRGLQTIEKALESSPFSADVMQAQAERVLAQTKTAAEDLAGRFGQVLNEKQSIGELLRAASVNAAERFTFAQEKAYDKAFNLIGAQTPTPPVSIKILRQQMERELSDAPASLAPVLEPTLRILRALEMDATNNGGGIPFETFRRIRTNIGRDLADPLLAGSTGAQNEAKRRIYGALTEDMSGIAQSVGPDAAHTLEVADRYTRAFMNTAFQTLDKFSKFEADGKAFAYLMSAAKDNAMALQRLRHQFKPDEWNSVAGSVLRQIGLAKAGAQDATGEVFSVSTFLTRWNEIAPAAKEILFGGQRYAPMAQALDDLVRVVGSLKAVEKLTNTSNTARHLIAFANIQNLGRALGGLAVGSTAGGLAGGLPGALMGGIVAPRVAAKLITSPAFVKWLTTPVTDPAGIPAHMGRLVAVAAVEPEIREEIEQYLQVLKELPTSEGAPQEAKK